MGSVAFLRSYQPGPGMPFWQSAWLQASLYTISRIHFIRSEGLDIVSDSKTWMCLICGWIYDEAAGDPEHGIAPGTPWSEVPMNWTCPECGARKEDFEMVQI
jgi:rubredoxin